MRTARVAVIGDVGGHLVEFRAELERLGVDTELGRVPPGLLVVQVGDLVHRGPASDAVIELVDRCLRASPGRWLQLVGNHEAQYLGTPAFDWPETISPPSQERIRAWWSTGRMLAAVALPTDRGTFLVTHAGLTAGYWRAMLDVPATAEHAAIALNALIGQRESRLFRPGMMLGAGRPSRLAGPIWAEAAHELAGSWLDTRLPFSQLHGHSSIFDWDQGDFRAGQPPRVQQATEVDVEARHETTTLIDGVLVGIDPGHGVQSRLPWRAWEAELVRR